MGSPDRSVDPTVPVERLRQVTLFATLSDVTLRQVAEVAQRISYAADEHILLEGDRARAAYFVLSGEVRIYRVSLEGREQVLVRVGPGQAFNTVPPFLDENQNPANAMAVTPVTLCMLLQNDFLRLTAAHGDLALAILRDFAGRLTHLTDLVEGLALYTVQQRLARFLVQQAESEGAGPPVAQRWTQQEIAVHLGTVRDVVGRELRALEDAGLVRVERGRIVLLDREGIERLAGL